MALTDVAYHTRWYSCHYGIVRDIMGYDCSSTNYSVLPNRHASQDGRVATN